MKYIVLLLVALTSGAFVSDFDDMKKLANQGIIR
jgi:hypothetical protein|tara:strand:- start:138 stop:239 length:102 start_codon:yes stop_codon:yes gene_type:complete